MSKKAFACFVTVTMAFGPVGTLRADSRDTGAEQSAIVKRALERDGSTDRPAGATGDSPAAGSYYERSEEGWFWYQDPPVEEEAQQQPEDPLAVLPEVGDVKEDPLQQLHRVQEAVERAKARAVLHPTQENLQAWLQLNRAVQDRSTLFADQWVRTVWTTPTLDQSLVRPSNQVGLQAWTEVRNQTRRGALEELAETHGLFFFFSSTCVYCHQFAPFLRRFADAYGFEIVPISLDGGGIEGFPEARYEPTVVERLGVQQVPAVFLVEPSEKTVQPIAYGVVSLSELEDRIYRLMRMEPGDMVFKVDGGVQR